MSDLATMNNCSPFFTCGDQLMCITGNTEEPIKLETNMRHTAIMVCTGLHIGDAVNSLLIYKGVDGGVYVSFSDELFIIPSPDANDDYYTNEIEITHLNIDVENITYMACSTYYESRTGHPKIELLLSFKNGLIKLLDIQDDIFSDVTTIKHRTYEQFLDKDVKCMSFRIVRRFFVLCDGELFSLNFDDNKTTKFRRNIPLENISLGSFSLDITKCNSYRPIHYYCYGGGDGLIGCMYLEDEVLYVRLGESDSETDEDDCPPIILSTEICNNVSEYSEIKFSKPHFCNYKNKPVNCSMLVKLTNGTVLFLEYDYYHVEKVLRKRNVTRFDDLADIKFSCYYQK